MHVKRHGLALAFYIGLAGLALYWPLFHASTHVGGPWTTDYYHFHWNYWWIRHALSTPGLNIYETNFVLFPYTTNLAYHTLTPFWYPLWALLEPLTGTLIAMTIIIVLAMALTGWCAYALFVREGVPGALALAGGALFQLTPAMLLAVMLSTINYISLFWYPLALLLWGQVARHAGDNRRGALWAGIMGLGLYGLMMTDYQHILFAAPLLVPYGLLTLVEARNARDRLRLIGWGLLALALMTTLLWLVGPLPYLLAFDRSSLSPMAIDKAQSIPFPAGFVGRYGTYDLRIITLGALVVPATLATILASLTLLRRRLHDRRRRFWLALVIVPLLLSPGANITLGAITITLPYVWLHELFGGLFRSPARFAPALILPAVIFVGRTWKPVLIQRRRWPAAVGAAAMLAVMVEARLFSPMPIQPVVPYYAFYQRIGQERGEPYDAYAIVEVPVAGGSGEAWVGEFHNMETQFYGMTHGKRMLNGSIARAPLSHFWYWLYDDPMLAWLGQRRFLEPDLVESQLRERIFGWPIGYIVIHQDFIGRAGPTNQEIIGYLNTLDDLLCPPLVERDVVVYRTRWHPDGCSPRTPPETEPGVYSIDIGSPGDETFIGWGWHGPEAVFDIFLRWTGEYPQTQLYVDLLPGGYQVMLAAQAFWEARTLRLLLNGQPLGDAQPVGMDGLQVLTFELPPDVVGDGQRLNLTLDYDGVVVPAEVGQSGDPRRLAVAVDWIQFRRLP